MIEGERTGLVFVTVDSLQKEHQNIKTATQGESVAFKTPKPLRAGDVVYKFYNKK